MLEARNDLLAGKFAEIALVEIDIELHLCRFEEGLSTAEISAWLQWLIVVDVFKV